MGRREGRTQRREEPPPRRGGGLFAGLLIGLTLGIVLAAGVAWYINMGDWGGKKPENAAAPEAVTADRPEPQPPASARPEPVAPPPPPAAATAPPSTPVSDPAPSPSAQARPQVKPTPAPRTESSPPPKPRVNYTFYGILPGDKPAQPVEPPPSKDIWWLQIAALSDVAKAEQIRLRLAQLKLAAKVQKIDSNGQLLYRIRVGPYKREDDAFGDLDVLTENNFYARLLKETAESK